MSQKMEASFFKYLALLGCLIIVIFSDCRPTKEITTQSQESPLLEPKIPAGYSKIAPQPAEDGRQMLSQTATIFRANLKDIFFTYDECAGPRTNYLLAKTTTLAGVTVDSEVVLSIFGGPTPLGTWIHASELAQLALNSDYLIFLRNTDWTFSPVIGDLVFRYEIENGKEMLVDPSGHYLKGWNESGPELSSIAVSDPVGVRLYGFKNRDTSFYVRKSLTRSDSVIAQITKTSKLKADSSNAIKSNPMPVRGFANVQEPSIQDVMKGGMFQRPILQTIEFGNEYPIATDSLLKQISSEVDRLKIKIDGRISWQPYWRCWRTTPTTNGKNIYKVNKNL